MSTSHASEKYSGGVDSLTWIACSIAPNESQTSCTVTASSNQKLWLVIVEKRSSAAIAVIAASSHRSGAIVRVRPLARATDGVASSARREIVIGASAQSLGRLRRRSDRDG